MREGHSEERRTSTPSGRAMFPDDGRLCRIRAGRPRERVLSGLARANAEGVTLGRPTLEDSDARKVTAIKVALAAGKGIPHEEVMAWLRSWGTPNELPAPKPGPS